MLLHLDICKRKWFLILEILLYSKHRPTKRSQDTHSVLFGKMITPNYKRVNNAYILIDMES
jgi:hypothetical protein